ncbi:hypothetical protein EMIHUDRAFT_445292, partial [Emiliania huxleyi CCMP1516]
GPRRRRRWGATRPGGVSRRPSLRVAALRRRRLRLAAGATAARRWVWRRWVWRRGQRLLLLLRQRATNRGRVAEQRGRWRRGRLGWRSLGRGWSGWRRGGPAGSSSSASRSAPRSRSCPPSASPPSPPRRGWPAQCTCSPSGRRGGETSAWPSASPPSSGGAPSRWSTRWPCRRRCRAAPSGGCPPRDSGSRPLPGSAARAAAGSAARLSPSGPRLHGEALWWWTRSLRATRPRTLFSRTWCSATRRTLPSDGVAATPPLSSRSGRAPSTSSQTCARSPARSPR